MAAQQIGGLVDQANQRVGRHLGAVDQSDLSDLSDLSDESDRNRFRTARPRANPWATGAAALAKEVFKIEQEFLQAGLGHTVSLSSVFLEVAEATLPSAMFCTPDRAAAPSGRACGCGGQ
jgi:hypothetical protein